MKILILNTTGLGNILLFLPAYRYLLENCKNIDITVVFDSRWYDDEFMRYQFKEAKRLIKYPFNKKKIFRLRFSYLKMIIRKYDYVVMPFSEITYRRYLFLKFIPAREKIYFTQSKRKKKKFVFLEDKNNEHFVIKNLKQVKYILKDSNDEIHHDIKNYVFLNNKDYFEKAENELWVGIHPGGNVEYNPFRQWPHNYYNKLIELLKTNHKKIKIFLFGTGEYEKKLVNNVIKGHENISIRVHDKPLMEVASKIKNCDIFIGNDSGLMHLASGLGIKTFGILGPTNHHRTGPYGKDTHTIRIHLECSPCFNIGTYKSCTHFSCLKSIKPDKVFEIIKAKVRSETI